MTKNAIVGQSGGPTSVINSSLAGVYESCKRRGAGKVYGMMHGVAGLLERRVCVLDDKLKSAKDLSARWTSVLQAPLTGRYSFMFEGSGRVSIRIDGKVVFRKGSNQKVRGSFELPLVKGQEYQVEVEACGMKAQQTVRLSWRPPFDDKGITPEKLAKESDVAILFLRDDNSSEGRDRKDLHWGEAQIELIRKVTEANPNTILILGSGSPLMLAPFVRLPKAILNVWIGGQGEI